MRRILLAVLAGILTAATAQAEIPVGRGDQTVDANGTSLKVFTYRPRCENPSLLVVFHGLSRNAKGYRNAARPIANNMCMLVVAPLFDKRRFPTARYQRGGVMDGKRLLPPKQRTLALVRPLVRWVFQQEGRRMDYAFIGHSGGGQFLSRMAAFMPMQARRIVIANPSTHVMPSLRVRAPYGLGGIYHGTEAKEVLRRYLEAPVTIYLGADDNDDNAENLATHRAAMAQGSNRHERGMNAFNTGKAAAASNNWKFNWRLVEAPGVGHSARGMFGSDRAVEALKP